MNDDTITSLATKHGSTYTNRHFLNDPRFVFTAGGLKDFVSELLAAQPQAAQEPECYALRFPSDDRLCLSTVFDTYEEVQKFSERLTNRPRIVPLYDHPAPQTVQAAPQGWHSPGLGEVHNKDHTKMIYCTDGNDVASDEVASEVLNAMIAAAPSAPAQPELTQAARDVLAERQRQITAEGWTPEHDDEHADGGMAKAAACYALHTEPDGNVGDYLRFWPWDATWWKPTNRRRNLIKASALLLAEIERLDRAAARKEQA